MSHTMPTPDELLEIYTDIALQIDQVNPQKQAEIDKVIPREVKDQLEDIEAEFEPELANLAAKKKMVEDQLKYEVVNSGVKKIEGSVFTATMVRGRTTWDTKVLDSIAQFVPQVKTARKVGEPSVRITTNKR